MVEHLRPTGRIGTVTTPARVRNVKRDRHRQNRHDRKTDEEKREQPPEIQEQANTEADVDPPKNNSATGQRINVVI